MIHYRMLYRLHFVLAQVLWGVYPRKKIGSGLTASVRYLRHSSPRQPRDGRYNVPARSVQRLTAIIGVAGAASVANTVRRRRALPRLCEGVPRTGRVLRARPNRLSLRRLIPDERPHIRPSTSSAASGRYAPSRGIIERKRRSEYSGSSRRLAHAKSYTLHLGKQPGCRMQVHMYTPLSFF